MLQLLFSKTEEDLLCTKVVMYFLKVTEMVCTKDTWETKSLPSAFKNAQTQTPLLVHRHKESAV